MSKRKVTNYIAVHCSATRPGMEWGAREIDRAHRQRGFERIGYHYVIKRCGEVEPGRGEDEMGAHVRRHNHDSVGVCLVGGVDDELKPENNFTAAQFDALAGLLRVLRRKYPGAKIQGHRDFAGVDKACPSFDVGEWLQGVTL